MKVRLLRLEVSCWSTLQCTALLVLVKRENWLGDVAEDPPRKYWASDDNGTDALPGLGTMVPPGLPDLITLNDTGNETRPCGVSLIGHDPGIGDDMTLGVKEDAPLWVYRGLDTGTA